jgi:metallo-beta-lactamase class B
LIGLVAAWSITSPAQERVDWGARAHWRQWDTPPPSGGTGREASRRAPFKIFDNVYYVGLHNVAAYLVTTSAGLVLLDATYPDTADWVIDNIRTLGFDPSNLRYVFVSHAHGDHSGGAARIQRATGARVGLSAEDWAVLERSASGPPLKRDLVVKDGETINVGTTAFTFYVSPGHTPGSLTSVFPVTDEGRSYRAVSPGGLGYNFGPEWTARYIESIERLKTVAAFDVLLPNHPYMTTGGLFAQVAALSTRAAGAPHPVVLGPERIRAFFDETLKLAREKLAAEKQQDRR